LAKRNGGGTATVTHLFAAILLFSSPGCPHEEPTCITPTEYIEINLRPDVQPGLISVLEALRLHAWCASADPFVRSSRQIRRGLLCGSSGKISL